jgi:hypothetical protein
MRSRDNVVGIATGYELDDLVVGFSLLHVETSSGAHPAPYPMGSEGFFHAGKAAGACS